MNTMNYAEIKAKAIPLNRQARVSQESLTKLRQALAGNQLALDHLGKFLQYANRLLEDAEKRKKCYYDIALAIVEYGDQEFWFVRKAGPL
jgi:DNA-directed RNA polymerase specialized sigma54-like protein